MELLWFFNPSLGADYGCFTCMVCHTEFYYSPRLDCHCNRCALNTLQHRLSVTKDEKQRRELQEYVDVLNGCR
jgi:hypothetical protein